MKENYYDILEVSKKASPEVIKKAYLTLVKKYHPDLQDDAVKAKYENKLKLINEAYEVLSDEIKEKNYDFELAKVETENSNINNYEKHSNNTNDNGIVNNINETNSHNEEILRRQQLEYQRQVEDARQKAYYDAYIQDLKNRGYKIRYKKSFKDYVKNFIALILTIIILFLLYQIPFVQNFFKNIYEENELIKILVNGLSNLFQK